jgi:hypothetical protein
MSPIIEAAAYEAARVIQNELMAQAPSEKIAKGITVEPVFDEGGEEISVDFEIVLDDSVFYGSFLNTGTLAELDPSDDAEWNPEPGKGKGGIKPRYWLNWSEEIQVRIDLIIEAALELAQEKEIEKQLDEQFN